jgi:hypothetical protein
MSETTKTEQPPPEPIRLSVNCIADGRFFCAGTPLPFQREDLPEALKAFISTGSSATPFEPSERNLYNDMSPHARHQARRLAQAAQEKDWAEEQASAPLREDIAAALADEHDIATSRAKAQAEYDQALSDAAHAVMQPVPPPQFYVRRGGEWAHVERAKLKVGETVFVRRESGQMESVGAINQNGEPPEPEIQL